MAKKLDPAELLSFKELLMTNSIQIDILLPAIDREGTDLSRGIFQTGTPKLDSKRPGQTISENKHDISTKRFE